MLSNSPELSLAADDDVILVTGAAGFIGTRVVAGLLERGFRNLRCFIRPGSNRSRLDKLVKSRPADTKIEIVTGNLLSGEDSLAAARDAVVIYHLAAGTGMKSFSDAFMNSVVTTRNLLEATLQFQSLRRFVSLSSFAVYTNQTGPRGRMLDESSAVEEQPEGRAEAYCFAKVKQDELVLQYGKEHRLPFVLLRPGVVYGPGKQAITGRVGVNPFGLFLHLGGSNPIPFTYVDNCADAIILAGLKPGIDGQIFNILDDDLPSSRKFLQLYKKHVKPIRSIYVPRSLSFMLCYLWERYCKHSQDQLPPIFTRREWTANWKKTAYTNKKLKQVLGWSPRVTTAEGLRMFFASCRASGKNA